MIEAVAQHVDGPGRVGDRGAEGFIQIDVAPPTAGHIAPELALKLINRLFAAGLHLAALQSLLGDGALRERAAAAGEELDLLIRDIRVAAMR